MASWSEDFTTCGLEEILQSQAENRAWSKELRRRNNDLVNNRLANNITQADYVADRKLVHEDSAECRRRANILDSQISRRTVRPLVRES